MAYQPKSYRKFLAGSVSAALVATAVGPVVANAASFSDVNPSDPHAANINALVELGYIKGFEDGTFKPYQSITRGQVAKIFARILEDQGFKAPEKLEQAFDDVPLDHKDQELVKAAAIVKAAGVMTGSQGKLNPTDNITRQQMAKVLVEAFDLTKPADFKSKITDLDQADAWARDYIQTLEANGVTVVTEYKPKDSVVRAQFASFVKRALDASSVVTADDITAVKFVDENTLEVTFNGELKDVKKEDFSIEGVEIDSVSIKAAAAAESKTTVVVIKTKTKLEEGKTYTVAYKGKTTDKTKVEVPVVTPKVESVSAINLKQFVVTFNKAVDKETAEDVDNYELETEGTASLTGAKLELQEDGKSVLVTLGTEAEQQEKVTVTIENVKDVNGTVIEDTTFEDVEFLDTTLPEALSAEVVGNDTIKVKFSEPIKTFSKDDFEVDGGSYFIKDVYATNNNTELNIELYSSLEEGTVKVEVGNGVEDYAGFGVLSKTFEVEVVEDTEAPTIVGYKNAKPNQVTLIFNEDIEINDSDVANFYHTNTNNTVDDAGSGVADYDLDGNELTLYFNDNNLPKGTAYIYIEKDAINDLWDNKNSKLVYEVQVNVDTEAPTLKDLDVEAEDQIILEFSEELEDVDVDNFTILDKDGKEVEDIIDSVSLDATKKKVTINFEEKLSGDYSIVIEELTDLAGNEIAKTTKEFTVDDLTAPKFADFEATLYKAGQKGQMIKVNFGEEMATEGKYSVLDLEKYKVGSYNLSELESEVKIVSVDGGKAVEIYIPSTVDDDDNGVDLTVADDITLARVADAAGNYTNDLSSTIDVVAPATIDFTAKATDTKTIVVTFEDALTDFEASDLKLQKDGTDITPAKVKTSVDEDGNTVVTYTLNDSDEMSYDAETSDDKNYSVVAVGSESTNKYGQTITRGSVTVEDAIVPALAEITVDGEDVADVRAIEDKVVLTFTEDINPNTVSLVSFEVEGYDVTDVNVAGNVIELTVEPKEDTTPTTPKLGTKVTQKATIKDVAGNALTDLSAEVAVRVTDATPPAAPTFGSLDAYVNATEEGEVVISGTAEAGSTVAISLDDANDATDAVVATVTADDNGNFAATVDISSLDDGTITVSATATDAANNTSDATPDTFVKDTTAPTASVADVDASHVNIVIGEEVYDAVTGNAISNGADMTAYVTGTFATSGVTITSAVWDATNNQIVVTLSGNAASGETVVLDDAELTDVAGNPISTVAATFDGTNWN
jgi:trimeric autotransporter adhesin